MMSAKYYKAKTHEIDILKDYDYYIWIDGTIKLQKDSLKNILEIINNDNVDLVNFKHPHRNNIYDESIVSEDHFQRYVEQKVKEQYKIYEEEGFPDNFGLYALGFIIKKNNNYVNNIFDRWWIENLKYSYQDQISYPYVLWKFKIENEGNNDYKYTKPDYVIEDNIFNNEKFSIRFDHK
jgi:hypothetical protein